jgi:DNA-binding XRE family transcriptional regulator
MSIHSTTKCCTKKFDIFCARREELGITQADMASYLDITQQAYSLYENGKRKMDFETALKIGEKIDLSLDDMGVNFRVHMQERKMESSNIEAVFTDHIRMIPVYESVSAGFGTKAHDSVIDYLPIRIVSDYESDETICIRVSGDSMHPKIEDGAIIQVHHPAGRMENRQHAEEHLPAHDGRKTAGSRAANLRLFRKYAT